MTLTNRPDGDERASHLELSTCKFSRYHDVSSQTKHMQTVFMASLCSTQILWPGVRLNYRKSPDFMACSLPVSLGISYYKCIDPYNDQRKDKLVCRHSCYMNDVLKRQIELRFKVSKASKCLILFSCCFLGLKPKAATLTAEPGQCRHGATPEMHRRIAPGTRQSPRSPRRGLGQCADDLFRHSHRISEARLSNLRTDGHQRWRNDDFFITDTSLRRRCSGS